VPLTRTITVQAENLRMGADGRRETGDGRRETGDGRRETGDGRRETGDRRWEMGRPGTWADSGTGPEYWRKPLKPKEKCSGWHPKPIRLGKENLWILVCGQRSGGQGVRVCPYRFASASSWQLRQKGDQGTASSRFCSTSSPQFMQSPNSPSSSRRKASTTS